MSRPNTSDFTWYYGTGQSPNYPQTGPPGDKNGNSANGYVYVDSSAAVVGSH